MAWHSVVRMHSAVACMHNAVDSALMYKHNAVVRMHSALACMYNAVVGVSVANSMCSCIGACMLLPE